MPHPPERKNKSAPHTAPETLAEVEKLNKELQALLYDGTVAEVSKLIKRGARIDAPLPYSPGVRPIHISARAGRTDLIKLFIQNGADINARTDNGNTPLHYAAANGQTQTGTFLLEHGADANITDYEGVTALMDCIKTGNDLLFDRLLPHTRTLEAREKRPSGRPGQTALLRAAHRGNLHMLSALHKKGANLETTGSENKTALHFAVTHNNPELVDYVLNHAPAIINWQDDSGETALHKAIMTGQADIVQKLLDNGADIHIRNQDGHDALLFCAKSNKLDLVNILAPMITDFSVTDNDGCGLLHLFAIAGNATAMTYLAQYGLDIEQQDKSGQTPLFYAAQSFRGPAALDALIRLSAKLDHEANNGYTPAHIAVTSEKLDNLARLIQAGVNIHHPNKHGIAPITLAKSRKLASEISLLYAAHRAERMKRLHAKKRHRTALT